MKKIFLTICLTFGMIFGIALISNAANYTIPQLAVAPDIDGVVNSNEWYGAYTEDMSFQEGHNEVSTTAISLNGCKSYKISQCWYYDGTSSRSGYYFCVVAQDSTRGKGFSMGTALTETDSVAIYFDPLNTRTDSSSSTLLFSFCPWTGADRTGPAGYFEHRAYNGLLTNGAKVKVSSVVTDNDWTMEFFIPFSALTMNNTPAQHDDFGTTGMGIYVRDYDGNSMLYGCSDFGKAGGNFGLIDAYCSQWNVITLGQTVYSPGYNSKQADLSGFMSRLKKADSILMDSSEYTADSISEFTRIWNEVNDYSSRIQQSVADEYSSKLDNAFNLLVKKYYSENNNLVTSVSNLNQSDFTSDTWTLFSDALAKSSSVTNQDSSSNIKAAFLALKGSYENLVKVDSGEHIINTDVTDNLLTTYNSLDANDYSEKTWNVYESSINTLKNLNPKDNKQSDYDNADQNVKSAFEALTLADKSTILSGGDNLSEKKMDTVLLVYIICMSLLVVIVLLIIIPKIIKKRKTAVVSADKNIDSDDSNAITKDKNKKSKLIKKNKKNIDKKQSK